MHKCEKNAAKTGVVIKTWSGHANGPICNVRGKSNIRHFVKLVNLRLYPIDVKCKGEITSDPRLIEFSCTNSNHTPIEWEESIQGLGSNMDHTFSPCELIPTNGGNGTETVHTEVIISVPTSRNSIPLLLSIEVDA